MPDRNADGTAAADVLIRRLEFPIQRWDYSVRLRRSTFVLGHPLTQERDVQPLRAGQFVRFDKALGMARIRGVGEGIIWLDDREFVRIRPHGIPALFLPTRLIRPDQYDTEGRVNFVGD